MTQCVVEELTNHGKLKAGSKDDHLSLKNYHAANSAVGALLRAIELEHTGQQPDIVLRSP
jgi:hypothetical protein